MPRKQPLGLPSGSSIIPNAVAYGTMEVKVLETSTFHNLWGVCQALHSAACEFPPGLRPSLLIELSVAAFANSRHHGGYQPAEREESAPFLCPKYEWRASTDSEHQRTATAYTKPSQGESNVASRASS